MSVRFRSKQSHWLHWFLNKTFLSLEKEIESLVFNLKKIAAFTSPCSGMFDCTLLHMLDKSDASQRWQKWKDLEGCPRSCHNCWSTGQTVAVGEDKIHFLLRNPQWELLRQTWPSSGYPTGNTDGNNWHPWRNSFLKEEVQLRKGKPAKLLIQRDPHFPPRPPTVPKQCGCYYLPGRLSHVW